ncbi:MAG TPA: hypothetical protein VER17_14430 [Tepidisphaeraceae bacterium]|nr:hypothetical protein [Tepidisphaeraceae bacterium]
MLAAIDPTFVLVNRLEAGLWIAIAVILGIASAYLRGAERRDAIVAAVAFTFFGLSDIVETRTGAWWRPWWLLAWKAACVVAFVVLLAREARRWKRRR